ncbi:hypothetical protein [Segatella salivae]|nr:hypothetical protein [Segatella salivae]
MTLNKMPQESFFKATLHELATTSALQARSILTHEHPTICAIAHDPQ